MRVHLRTSALVGAALALALLGGGLSGAENASQELTRGANADAPVHPGGSEEPGEQGDEDAAAADPTVELVFAPLTPVVAASDSEAKFRVLLRNSGERSLPEGSIELRIGDRLTEGSVILPPEVTTPQGADSAGADATGDDPAADADGQLPTGTVIATADVGSLTAHKDRESTITVPVADIPLTQSSEHGVYPVEARYVPSESSAEPVTAFSPIVWEGTAAQPIKLTLVVPLVLPDTVPSMPTREQLDELAPGFDALLDYATKTHAVLAIDPRLIAAIRGYGTEAPAAAQELLTKLERSTLMSFLLQYGDADPAAQAELGATELLAPVGLDFITRFGAWEPVSETPSGGAGQAARTRNSAAAGETAQAAERHDTQLTGTQHQATTANDQERDDTARDDTVQPDERGASESDDKAESDAEADSGEPTLAELGAWEAGVPGSWPAPGQVNSRTMSLVRGAGLDLTVLRSDNVSLNGGPRAALGDGSAIITDTELDAGVALALGGSSETERELGAAQAAARLVLAADRGLPGIALGVDRGAITEASDPVEMLSALTSQRWIAPVTLAEQDSGTAKLRAASASEERTELLQAALDNEDYVLETRAVLVNPEYLDSYQRMRLLTLFATRNASERVNFFAVAQQFSKRDSELHDGVRLVGAKHAQLVGGSSRVPIQLRNSLPFDAVVELQVLPTSAALSVPERHFRDVLLPEDSTDRVLVPVKSRVSSGESSLLLTVTSADGEFVASDGVLSVSISTTVEIVAIALLGAAAAALFGFGIWRSVRRRRAHSAGE